jgi:hypothetical protein
VPAADVDSQDGGLAVPLTRDQQQSFVVPLLRKTLLVQGKCIQAWEPPWGSGALAHRHHHLRLLLLLLLLLCGRG